MKFTNYYKIVISLLVVLIIAYGSYFLVSKNKTITSGQKAGMYSNESLGMSFKYPKNFTLIEQQASTEGDKQQPIIIILLAKDGKISLVPSVRSIEEVEKEKAFYESILFNDPTSSINSRIKFESFDGFRSSTDAQSSLNTVYKNKDENETLTLRTEVVASSTATLSKHEETLISILKSISFKQKK